MSRNANQEDVKVEVSTETLTPEVPATDAPAASETTDEFVPATTAETATEVATTEALTSGPAVEETPTVETTPTTEPTAFTTAEVKPAKVTEKPAKAAKAETPKKAAKSEETVSVRMNVELAYKANRFNKGDTAEFTKRELEDLLPAWYEVV